MPAASSYNPTDKDQRNAAETERGTRRNEAAIAWQYYRGEHPKPLKVKPGRPDNNVIVNLVQQHADHTVAFAAPDFPKLKLDDPDDQTVLDDWWKRQHGAGWLINTMLSGLLVGHVFCRLLPSNGRARVLTLNPANVIVFWAADDYETPLWYEVHYSKGVQRRRLDVIAPSVLQPADIPQGDGSFIRTAGERWTLLDYVQTKPGDEHTAASWEPAGAPVIWDYDTPPIIDWQHMPNPGSYYGAHELRHRALNDAVNKVASDIKAILRTHASPRRVAVGIPPSAIKDTAIDSFWAIEGKKPDEVRIDNLEMQSDLQSSMNFMHFLSDAYMQQARVTQLTGGPDAYKNVTNLGIKAAFMSQIAKTETIHRQYGTGIARLSVGGLELEQRPIIEPGVDWPSALPLSEKEQTDVQGAQLAMGVQSKQGAAVRLGNPWQDVQRQRLEEAIADEMITGGAPVGVSG